MALYKVIDDYLPQQQYINLYKYMTGYLPNWKFIPYITYDDNRGDEGAQFVIPIQSDTTGLDDPHNYFAPLLNKLNAIHLIRIKANCTLRTDIIKQSMLHCDYDFPCVTAIYHINTCDGYTHFEDGSKVDTVGNRMIIFPSHVKHGGSTTTSQRFRMVINFNYHMNT